MTTTKSNSLMEAASILCRAPIYRSLKSRAHRRVWVVITGLSLVSLGSQIWFDPENTVVAIVGLLILSFFMIGVGVATLGMADVSMRKLDEQQRSMRLSLFSDPYMVGATVGLMGGMFMSGLFNTEREMLTAPIIVGIFGLPALVMAWKLPDTEADDE